MKKLFVCVLTMLMLLSGCGMSEEPFATDVDVSSSEYIISIPTEDISYMSEEDRLASEGVYMLEKGYDFYKGSIDKSSITYIMFTDEEPQMFEESWNANVADTGDIKGYLVGSAVLIVGKHIYLNSDSSYMFASKNEVGEPLWGSLHGLGGLENLNTSMTIDMSGMFYNSGLDEISGIDNWDVNSVVFMSSMFENCESLKGVNIGGWLATNITDTSKMFKNCKGIQWLDMYGFNMSGVQSVHEMFYGCASLVDVVSRETWDLNGVAGVDTMYDGSLL